MMTPDEFHREDQYSERASLPTGEGATANERLLEIAEKGTRGQVRTVARLLAGLYNGSDSPIDPYDLRALDVEISDDLLACLDTLRRGKTDLHTLVPRGDERTWAVIDRWDIQWPDPGT